MDDSSAPPPHPVYHQGITFAQPAIDELRPLKRSRPPVASTSAVAGPSTFRRARRDSLEPPSGMPSPQNKKIKLKLPLSCGECRRLKLKCDRVFPCQSCVKRGCAEICPDGSLISGKGSRFILANTEQLHEKIVTMSERIRLLEDALSAATTTPHSTSHPLLTPDLLSVKYSIELYSATHSGPSNSPSISHREGSDGMLTRPSTSTPSKSTPPILPDLTSARRRDFVTLDHQPAPSSLPEDLAQLSLRLPLPWTSSVRASANIRQRIRDMLPSREEAQALGDQATENALWQHNPALSETFLPELVEHVYTAPLDSLSPQRLAIMFMILAIGCSVDLRQHRRSPDAELYHHLARISLCDSPETSEESTQSVMAMFFMIWYLLIFHDQQESVLMAWGIMGMAARVAQSIGLHRDGDRWNLSPAEIQSRRALFWELVSLDARLSVCLVRPPAFPPQYHDTRQPSFPGPSYPMLYFEWKQHFMTICLLPALEQVAGAQPPKYSAVVSLDSAIREACVPPFLRLPYVDDAGAPAGLIMQRANVSMGRDILLLQLHRPFFTQALNNPDTFNPSHPYIISIVATVYSACQMVACLDVMYTKQPALASRFPYFWSSTLAGAVSLSLLMARLPFCPFVPLAIPHLEKCVALFRRASNLCPKAEQSLPILEQIMSKGNRAVLRWREGLPCVDGDGEFQEVVQLGVLAGHTELAADALPTAVADEDGSDPFTHIHPTLLRILERVTKAPHPPPASQMPLPHPQMPQLPAAAFVPWNEVRYGDFAEDVAAHERVALDGGGSGELSVMPTEMPGSDAAAQTASELGFIPNMPPQVQEYFISSAGAQPSAMYHPAEASWMDPF